MSASRPRRRHAKRPAVIDLELTPAQQNVRDMLHWFAAERIRPLTFEADRTGRFPDDFHRELMRMGVAQGMGREEALGEERDGRGARQTNRFALIAAEELAWGDPAVVTNIPGPGLGAPPVRASGTPEQQARFF